MKRLLQGVIPSLNLPDGDVLEINSKKLGSVPNMSSRINAQASTSKCLTPPNKKMKIGEASVKSVNTKAEGKTTFFSTSSGNSSTTILKRTTQNSEIHAQANGTETFDASIIKDEVEEIGAHSEDEIIAEIKIEEEDDVDIKQEIEDDDHVTSFSLKNVKKIEIKHEGADSDDTDESFSDESENLELKEEELIIKEETDEEEESEAPTTSSASTQTNSSYDDKPSTISQEVERLLAQLRPKKKAIRGVKAQFTDNDVFQFTITLLRGRGAPRIWRRFQVPATYTFREFHIAIQKAMGWKSVEYDYHLHAFRLINPSTGFEDSIVIREDVGLYGSSKDENVAKIKDYFTIINHKGRYEYDFGIGWEHEYAFEGAFPRVEGKTYPICMEGEKACPPEDGVVGSDEEYDSDVFDAQACF